jgi:hypothetical protein
MKNNPLFKKQLDAAAKSVKDHLVKDFKLGQVPVRVDLGNEGGVSIKSAVLKVEKLFPLKGKANLVFDLHFRHVAQKEKRLPVGIKIPAIIPYDRHEELVVEYDINEKKARARVAKGPFQLQDLPKVEYEVWVTIDLSAMK